MARLAYKEIVDGGYDDALATWCRVRHKQGLCKNETKDVQQRYRQIATYLQENGKMQQVREFLSGADGWIIAFALATNGVVVTTENEHRNQSKIKIPTVAKVFGVRCLNTPGMLQELRANFSPQQ